MTQTYAKGEIWEVTGRKGPLTIQLCENVDMSGDDFFEATIIEGKARYVSASNNAEQKLNGLGTKGDTISFRTTLTRFFKRREDLELDLAEQQAKWRAGEPPQ